jgi:hypothetical protein
VSSRNSGVTTILFTYPIGHRLQDETARVEDYLVQGESLDLLVKCFVVAKANSFENLLDPFLKICRLSTAIALGVSKAQFFRRLVDKLGHHKAVVRLNLLRLLRAVCDVNPEREGLVEKYGLYTIVEKLSRKDGAVLVRELAREILPVLTSAAQAAGKSNNDVTPRKRAIRRTASEASVGLSSLSTSEPNTRQRVKPARHKLNDISWQSGVAR